MIKPRSTTYFNAISELTDHLYLCGANAVNAKNLSNLGITCIVNATVELPSLLLPDIDYVHVPVVDSTTAKIYPYFDEIADKINSVRLCGGKTLVHCVAGVSRSTSLCIAYLMKYSPKMSLIEAYHYVKDRRSFIKPNHAFMAQLIEYEKKLFNKETVKMIQTKYGIIPDVYEEEDRHTVLIYETKLAKRDKMLNNCVEVEKETARL